MHRRHSTATGLLFACCLTAQLAQLVLAAPMATAAAAASAALATAPGGQLTITGLQLEGESLASSLQLQRRDVWSSSARVVVHTAAGEARQAPPPTRWFTGSLAGAPGSSVLLAVHPDGRMTGTASRTGASWSLSAAAPAGPTAAAATGRGLVARKAAATTGPTAAAAVAAAQPAGPRCGNKGRMLPPGRTSTISKAPVFATAPAKAVSSGNLQATIAVDTDAEFCALFADTQAAANYVALMVAYLDAVYSREVGVSIKLGQLELRPNRTAADYPTAYKPINLLRAGQGLRAVMNWWNANRRDVPRTVVMYLSGQRGVKDVGMAWDEVLCDWHRAQQEGDPTDNWAYGFISNLRGAFSWNGINEPAVVNKDVFNFAHELGHSFGSPHTHEFCNILGNPNTIDDCVQSEGYWFQGVDKAACPQPSGFGILPNCTAKPTAPGGGVGTIMSYCDELAAGAGYNKNVAMTFGLNHPCGNEPGRVVQVMKAHMMDRVAVFPQCFQPVVPRPSPPPPIPRPPPAPQGPSGNWSDPVAVATLPYTSPIISGWVSSSRLPIFCNDTATPLNATGNRLPPRGVKVFRFRSGATAKGKLVVSSCGLTTKGSPAVSVRATTNTANPMAGPWTCEGAATSGCGTQGAGFRLAVNLRPNMVYAIIAGSQGTIGPQYKLSIAAQDGTLAALATPLGSWRYPNSVPSLPFTSAQFSVFHANTVPAECNDLVLRKKDSITKYTGPARVFRLWLDSTAQGSLNINSCAGTRAGDRPNVSVRTTTNRSAPLNGPWQCPSLARTAGGGGCGTANNGFNVTVPATQNTWVYIIVSHTNTGAPPLLRLSVKKV